MHVVSVVAVLFLFPSREDAEGRKQPGDQGAAFPVYFLRWAHAMARPVSCIEETYTFTGKPKLSAMPVAQSE